MRKYGYVRVSTKEQKTDRQMDALEAYGIPEDRIFIDQLSGKDFERPEYRRLLRRMKRSDVLVIKSIDRLGRNYNEILEQWRYISKDKGINIEVIDMPLLNTETIQNGLTGVLISDLALQLFAYMAETERAFIRQRQREGIEAAKKRGVKFGRPRADVTEEFDRAYKKYVSKQMSSREAARIAGMPHASFYRRCRERREQEAGRISLKG